MTARGGHLLVDEELRSGVRSALHHQEGLSRFEVALRERRHLTGLVLDLGRREPDRRVVLERCPAVRAEARIGGVSMSTVGAEHSRLPLYLFRCARSRLGPPACALYTGVDARVKVGALKRA